MRVPAVLLDTGATCQEPKWGMTWNNCLCRLLLSCMYLMNGCDRFHDVRVYLSGLGREHGTKNETLALQDPQQVPKPKCEAMTT